MSKSKKEVSVSVYNALLVKVCRLLSIIKSLRTENRQLKKTVKRISASRNNWKEKAVKRRESQDKLKKQLNRRTTTHSPKRHQYATWLITLVLVLRIYCNCSYGSITKILEIWQKEHLNSKEQLAIPSKKTQQNWVSKVGYYYLKEIDNELFKEDLCLIMDESVRLGTERLFVALVCPYKKWKQGSLTYDQVRVIYLAGRTSWTGDEIAAELTKVIKEKGLKVKYVVSDEGTNLKRATRLLKLPYVADISHLVATCLKKTFKNRADYKAFAKTVGQCGTKLSMGSYSFLRPYKLRVKARFLNQGKVVNWATTILDKWDSLDQKAQDKLVALPEHRQVIKILGQTLDLANKVANILKDNGLNQYTIQQTQKLVSEVIENSATDKIVTTFAEYLQIYLKQYSQFLNEQDWQGQNLPVCSDVIERLFGRFKAKLGDNYFVTSSTISLEIPLMCLSNEELTQQVPLALETIFMTDLQNWKKEQNTDNQSGMRANFFKK